jgi:hypothetical protein
MIRQAYAKKQPLLAITANNTSSIGEISGFVSMLRLITKCDDDEGQGQVRLITGKVPWRYLARLPCACRGAVDPMNEEQLPASVLVLGSCEASLTFL